MMTESPSWTFAAEGIQLPPVPGRAADSRRLLGAVRCSRGRRGAATDSAPISTPWFQRSARPVKAPSAFAGFWFPRDVILLVVRWYVRIGRPGRDLEELLVERGIDVDHVTLLRCVQRSTPLVDDVARPCRHAVGPRGSSTKPMSWSAGCGGRRTGRWTSRARPSTSSSPRAGVSPRPAGPSPQPLPRIAPLAGDPRVRWRLGARCCRPPITTPLGLLGHLSACLVTSRLAWSVKDQEFIATVVRFPSLSSIADTARRPSGA
jgi:hypothetical protein